MTSVYTNIYPKSTLISDYERDKRILFNTHPNTYINSGIVMNKNWPQPATNYIGMKYINDKEISTNHIPIHPNVSGPPVRWSPYQMVKKQYSSWC